MIPLDVHDSIAYGVLEEADLHPATRLLADAFSQRETISLAIGLTQLEVERLATAFARRVISQQLSFVARDQTKGDVVGALLAHDFGISLPNEMEDVSPAFAPIGALLDDLDARYRSERTIGPGTHLHLFMLGVASHIARRGIAGHLLDVSAPHARSRGFSIVFCEATAGASQHLLDKIGYRRVFAQPYRDFVFQGENVFASIVDPPSALVMERNL